ncbi:DUF732 domain-containing protein [Mycobacterium sp. 050134]|uniref:DUF732 domain-containing protein n=1 Tax=Mycobacterium sp. 050134 TaxID=3096111 RepID=UPI002ED9DDAA
MRDRETIDAELRRIARGRQSIRAQGGQPSSTEVDRLLDELLAHSAGASDIDVVTARESPVGATSRSQRKKAARRRRAGLWRFGLFAALPLSLVAVAAAVLVMFTGRHHDSPAQPTETKSPPSAAPAPSPIAPTVPVPRTDIVDTAFIAALKHEGVPVPSQEYVTTQGHAVCDFLARRPNFADAVGFVQQSSIWDANQSANVTAGAIASYCPQSQPAAVDNMQPVYQDTLSDLQAIEGKLRGIQGDLRDIEGNLQGLPGHP